MQLCGSLLGRAPHSYHNHDPNATSHEATRSGAPERSGDLAILSAAASQLVECTRNMSRRAVVSLLSGLRDVGVRNIASGTPASRMPKLFALDRMVEVLLFNTGRIHDLWAIFLRCVQVARLRWIAVATALVHAAMC